MSDQTISVDRDALVTSTGPRQARSHGANIFVSASAYDVPRSVRIEIGKDLMTLSFLYLDHEEAEHRQIDDLMFQVGKNSGKLLRISGRPNGVHRILEAVEKQLVLAKRDNQKINYRIIQDLLKGQIEPALTGV